MAVCLFVCVGAFSMLLHGAIPFVSAVERIFLASFSRTSLSLSATLSSPVPLNLSEKERVCLLIFTYESLEREQCGEDKTYLIDLAS